VLSGYPKPHLPCRSWQAWPRGSGQY
jgi:hypothetical protein